MNARVDPDRATLDAFCGALFRYADEGTDISLRAFNDDRKDERPIFINKGRIGDKRLNDFVFNLATAAATHASRANFCPPICTFREDGKADEASIANGLVLTVECDSNPDESKQRLVAILGEPTITSASGGEWTDPATGEVQPKLHLHWRLTEPTRDAASHRQLKEARRLACTMVGADATAVPINHPIRWPGSVHRKGQPRLSCILAQTENEIELADVLDKLRQACPEAPRREAPRAGAGLGFGPDLGGDLLDIAAALGAIPNQDLVWDEWNRIAMATWNASNGGAFAAFDAWSRKSAKYDATVTADRWDHIGRHPPTSIGAGTLYHLAHEAAPGWRKPSSFNRDSQRGTAAPHDDDSDAPEGEQPRVKSSRSKKAPEREESDARPVIRLQAGVLARTVDEAERALIDAGCSLYQRSGLIVSVGVAPMLTAHRHRVLTPQIFEVGEHRLLEEMMRVAAFEKWDARAKDFVPTNAPMTLPKTLRERKGKLRLPILSGIINAPTLRDDGSLIEVPGYDEATGLLFDPAGTTFPAVKDEPTRQDAEAALVAIETLIDGFPFVGDADRSVALAAFLTATVRKSISTAPAFAFSAPVAGSGKSKLVDIMSVIATGREAGVIALGGNPEEAEKRVSALLLAGCAVAIDNVEGSVGGDILCQLLTQTTVRGRILGKSETPEMPTNVMVTVTGNNLSVEGDMTRRTLLCRLDPKVERPELREFGFDPVEKAKADRGKLLVAALTILRAYHVAERPRQISPLGSFGEWSDLVRSALLWLGQADPVDTMEKSRANDPKLERLRAVMVQWRKVIGSETVSAGEAAQRAAEKSSTLFESGRSTFNHAEFREALLAVCNSGGFVEPGKLGNWLSRNKGRVVDGMRLELVGVKHGFNQWALMGSPDQGARDYAARREQPEAAHAAPTYF